MGTLLKYGNLVYYKYNNRKWYFMPTFQSLMSCWFCRKAKTKTLHSPAYLPFLCFLNLCLTRRKVQSKGLIKSFYRIFRFEVCRIMLTCVYDESCIRCYFSMTWCSTWAMAYCRQSNFGVCINKSPFLQNIPHYASIGAGSSFLKQK